MKDALFFKVMICLFVILCLYGTGMILVIVLDKDHIIAARLISGFASMFAGILGVAAGYLLGRNGNGNGNGTH